MKRKILSLLLALCLVVGMVPVAASAETSKLPAAKNGVITLEEDVAVSSLTLPSESGGTITYDLNGQTLTYTGGTIVLSDNKTLVFKDTSVVETARGGTLALTNVTGTTSVFNPQAGATVSASNINITCTGSAFYPQGDAAAVNITNCDVTAAVYCVATNAATQENYNVDINLIGSTFIANAEDGDNCPIMINIPGDLTMTNCQVTGDRMGVLVRAGTATIEGCQINVTGEYTDPHNYETSSVGWGSGNEVPMAALIVGSKNGNYNHDAVCTVTDTAITAPATEDAPPAIYVSSNTDTISNLQTGSYKAQLTISGSNTNVTGDVVIADGKSGVTSTVEIKDGAEVKGTVTSNTQHTTATISNATVAAVTSTSGTAGKITIGENVTFTAPDSNTFEAAVNGKTYATLAEAIQNANDSDTVTLLKNVVLSSQAGDTQGALTITKNIILDGNGMTISANTDSDQFADKTSMINIQGNAKVVVKNLTIDSNKKAKHGLNITSAAGENTTVTVENVTIKNGTGYGIVCNTSTLVVNGLTTEGNVWGGVNVDTKQNNGITKVTINKAELKEDNSLYIENARASNGGKSNTTINGGTFAGTVSIADDSGNDVKGAKLVISGGKFPSNAAIDDYLAPGKVLDSSGTVVEDKPYVPPVTPSTPTYANTVSDTENGKVTASPTRPKEGATVTITATPDKGYEVGSVSVTDADGKAVAVTNAGNGKYTFKQPDSKVTIKVTFVWDNPFTDVGNAWYRNAIQYVYENNLMAGTGDTTFDPEVSLTRAMTAQILYNLEGKPKVDEEATFADMNEAPTWSVDAIAWAQDTGVVAGMGDNQFAPNAKVTREQFAQMMYNYAKYKKYDLTKTGDLSKFPDDGSVSDWAETAMSWANGNGLINGHEDSGLIDPAGNTIRGQAASIIMNFDKNVVK